MDNFFTYSATRNILRGQIRTVNYEKSLLDQYRLSCSFHNHSSKLPERLLSQVAVPLFDKHHWWLLVFFISIHIVEVVDTIEFNEDKFAQSQHRIFRDKMNVVAAKAVVDWLRQGGVSFKFTQPGLQMMRPANLVSQSNLVNTAFYTLMSMEEWTSGRTCLPLPRECSADLMKWFLR